MSNIVHVAVAVIINTNNEVCISLRHKEAHQGNLWEFPGGKVEPDETIEQALVREIKEELDLDVKQSRPLITINHNYGDKVVCLHVCKVMSYQGVATGLEGQQITWLPVVQLSTYAFPAANEAIIKAIQLPDKYLITGKFIDSNDFICKLKRALNNGIKLVQLRLKESSRESPDQVQFLIEQVAKLCQQADANLMLNLSADYMDKVNLSEIVFSGFHADSKALTRLSQRLNLLSESALFSASCHNREELLLAVKLKADFVVLSPVQKTASHPDMTAMGWQSFSDLIENIAIPVYALGGVSEDNMEMAWQHGAQGIAAISALWETESS